MSKPDITAVLAHYGFDNLLDFGGWRPVRCVFHNDRRASASYNPDEQVFRCHVCEIAGDAYAIVMQREGVDFVEAKRRVAELTGSSGTELSGGAFTKRSRLPGWTRDRARSGRALSSGNRRRLSR